MRLADDWFCAFQRSLSHRISRGEFAAAYFGLDPQEATWGRSDLDSLLQAQSPRDALGQLVSKTQSSILPERDKVRLRGQLLDALEEGFEAGNPSLTSDWFRAVLDVSPIFIRAVDVKPRGFLYHVTNEERLRWLLVRPMQGMSPDQRAGLIRPDISDLADISLLCVVFRSMAGDLTADGVTPPYREKVRLATRPSSGRASATSPRGIREARAVQHVLTPQAPTGKGDAPASLLRHCEDRAGRGYAAQRVRSDGNERRPGLGGEGARDEDGLVERAA